MNKNYWIVLIIVVIIIGVFVTKFNNNNKDMKEDISIAQKENIAVTPIEHATMALHFMDKTIYTDPTGGAEAFTGVATPDLVLLTDIHGDHFDPKTLEAIVQVNTIVIAPQAVADKLTVKLPGTLVILKNGETTTAQGFSIEAIAMYNLPESPTAFHTRGRGNGYVIEGLSKMGKRVYISGDTSGIPEMKNLKNIDLAFVSMNLPYTMSVEDAADAVLAMKPKRVTPYHYRGPDGLSDINKFRDIMNAGDANIEVDLMDFYPEN